MNNYNVIYKCPVCGYESTLSMDSGGMWEKHGWPNNLSLSERICDNCRLKTPGNEGIMAPFKVITIKEGDIKDGK